MKNNNWIKTLSSVAVLLVASNTSWAAGTAAGTDIDNTAEITYSVGGTPQTGIESSEAGNSTPGIGNGAATTFKVDKKIDVLVTTGTDVNVVPGSTGQTMTFTVLNEGNSTENFDLVATQVGTGDDFDTTGCSITSPTSPVSLAADANAVITVSCDIPASSATVTNGADSLIDLEASINGVTETAGADTADGVEVVFADDTGTATDGANRNGSHSATNTYIVNTADLSVAKTSAVISDPFNGTASATVFPKRIPGAVIEYTITVTNDGAEAAFMTIADTLPTDLTFVSCTLTGDAVVNASAPNPALGCSATGSTSFTLPDGSATQTSATLTIQATVN